MNARYIRCAVAVALGATLSACGPSKEAMCEEINASRVTPTDSKADEQWKYVKCLNAPDDYVRKLYKELKAREKK